MRWQADIYRRWSLASSTPVIFLHARPRFPTAPPPSSVRAEARVRTSESLAAGLPCHPLARPSRVRLHIQPYTTSRREHRRPRHVRMPYHAMPCHAMPCHAMPCHDRCAGVGRTDERQGGPPRRVRGPALAPYRSFGATRIDAPSTPAARELFSSVLVAPSDWSLFSVPRLLRRFPRLLSRRVQSDRRCRMHRGKQPNQHQKAESRPSKGSPDGGRGEDSWLSLSWFVDPPFCPRCPFHGVIERLAAASPAHSNVHAAVGRRPWRASSTDRVTAMFRPRLLVTRKNNLEEGRPTGSSMVGAS